VNPFRWPPWLRVTSSAVAGAVTGLLVYLGAQLPAFWLAVAGGTVTGVTIGLVAQVYRRAVRLTGATLSVPQLGQLHFAITRESQQVAWRMFVELVTRISTQPLDDRSGRLRSALNSLYSLLGFTRELLRENPPSQQTGPEPTVEELAITMLNAELRPFLIHWHRTLTDWRQANPDLSEADWPLHAQCRSQLVEVQGRLRQYAVNFGQLAGVPNAERVATGSLPHAGT
jgi:hypothetical protein